MISARGAALYAARVDQQQTAESGASRWSVTSLLTPLVRFGLPTLAALGFFTWMLWPGAGEEPSLTGTQDTAVEKPTVEIVSTTTPVPKAAVTTTVVIPTSDAPSVTTTAPPAASTAESRYVPDRSTDENSEAPPAPPPPQPFQLPPLQLPKFQLPELPRLPLP